MMMCSYYYNKNCFYKSLIRINTSRIIDTKYFVFFFVLTNQKVYSIESFVLYLIYSLALK